MAAEASLCVKRLKWFHPRQVWYAFAVDSDVLPRPSARSQLGYTVNWAPFLRKRKRASKNDAEGRAGTL
jgi:hypothetical protein